MSSPHRMHGSMAGPIGFKRFLYWHRAYLLEFENALSSDIEGPIAIPYWDWVNSNGIPAGLRHVPIRGVNRRVDRQDFTSQEEIDRILLINSFDDFVYQLEVFPHNRGHNWVGGIMSDPLRSPTDPMFWLHQKSVRSVRVKSPLSCITSLALYIHF